MSDRTFDAGAMLVGAVAIVLLSAANGAGQAAPPAVQGSAAAPPRDRVAASLTGTARIRGQIVRADTGAPLPRAQVMLTGEQAIRRQVIADVEGRYEFADLPAGRFTVSATKGGYVTLQYGQTRPFVPGHPITLAVAQVISRIDLALPRGGVITGRVTDHFGEPVVGAEVQVERYQYDSEGRRRLNRAANPMLLTNDLGEFRAFGLMPGEYVVSAGRQPPRVPGQPVLVGSSPRLLNTYYPGTTNVDEAQTVVLDIGQEITANFSLASGRMSRVSGKVADSMGRPAAGASLMLTTVSNGSASGAGVGSVAADGSFSIGNISPGDHFIQVRLQLARAGGAFVSEYASLPISAAGDDVSGLQITTAAGATVMGRVEWEGSAPHKGSFGGRLQIITSSADRRTPFFGDATVFDSNGDGTVREDDRFRIAGIFGRVLFTPVAVPPQWMLKAVMVDGVDVTSAGTDAAHLAADARLRVVLTDKVTELSGSVRNAGHESMTDYVVLVLPDEPVESAVAARYTRTARPDRSGTFRIRALPPGRYMAAAVEALEQGSEWNPAFQATVHPGARHFTLIEGQTLTLDLQLMP
jgi:hypothetical protein